MRVRLSAPGVVGYSSDTGCVDDEPVDHEVAAAVDGHVEDPLLALSAQPRRVGDDRVDDQLARAVVVAHGKAHQAVLDDKVARNLAALPVDLLVGVRPGLFDDAVADGHEQTPVGCDDTALVPSTRSAMSSGSAPGRDHEVVLEVALVAVVDEVDALEHVLVLDARVRRGRRLPVRRGRCRGSRTRCPEACRAGRRGPARLALARRHADCRRALAGVSQR